MGKAIALVRVSTKVQELESQSLKVKEAILKDGYSEEDVISIEDKESGSRLSEEERSGLNKLKHTIETFSDIDSVYVYEISRISRKEHILYSIREFLRTHKVQLVCLTPYFRMFTPDWNISDEAAFTFSIFSTLSAQETRIRTARIMRGKEKKRSEGKLSCGFAKIGYTIDKDKYIIPHPEYSKVIQEIFERYSNLESSGSIARDLFLRKALPIDTTKIVSYQSIISSIIRDTRYAKIDPESIYPALISKELFYKCEDIRLHKPNYFIRKSHTLETYPLQGYLYNEEGYKLVPSISNNRYLKMRSNGTTTPISLNMRAADELTRQVLNKYLSSGVVEIDIQKQREELEDTLFKNNSKLANIDANIHILQRENDLIQSRIIKGRLSETKGDDMIDSNMAEIYSLEDTRQELEYQNTQINNRLLMLNNSFIHNLESYTINTLSELKEAVHKYIDKIIAHKIGFSRYRLEYRFKDGLVREGEFYSTCNRVDYIIK